MNEFYTWYEALKIADEEILKLLQARDLAGASACMALRARLSERMIAASSVPTKTDVKIPDDAALDEAAYRYNFEG